MSESAEQPTSTAETTEAQKSLREKTHDFLRRHNAYYVAVTGVPIATISGFITGQPLEGVATAGFLLGASVFMDKLDQRSEKEWEKAERKWENSYKPEHKDSNVKN